MIKKNLLYSTIIFSFIFSNKFIPPSTNNNWEIIQEKTVLISWKHHNSIDWCKASSIIQGKIELIQKILEDKENYPNIFERIEKTSISKSGNVHIVLDMPWPFAGRDYIVQYSQFQEGKDIVYRFSPALNSNIPIHEDYVRLINASGEWRIQSLDSTSTQVTYIWNGELLGDFPDWALTQAWIQQGEEVMTWLKNAVK